MDDYIDPFLSSASWSELHPSSSSSWDGNVASQTNGLLASPLEAYEDDENDPAVCMIPSSHIIGNPDLPNHQTVQHDNETHENSFSLKGIFGSNSTSCSVRLPQSALTMSNSMESNSSDQSNFPLPLGDAHSISSVPTVWPPSYSSFMEQGNLQTFGFQGVGSNGVLGKSYIENGNYQHLNNSAAATLHDHSELQTSHLPTFSFGEQMKLTSCGLQPHQQEQNALPNLQLLAFSTGPQVTLSKSAVVQSCQQLSQSTEGKTFDHYANHPSGGQHQATPANATGCNGAAKPRVRARRGQATDPHSIAERLRREKIAERMKNLQELVPNSNKADKASMLDEIIDYVKFLQLQVKVLSMSRLGAAGAVVPLITDVQSEGSAPLHLSSVGQGAGNISESEDNLAFEQEVVKMMESNVTTAMQYLQNKGLCLMPIALASAISTQKGSSAAAIPPERRKSEVSHGVISQTNDQSLADRSIRENHGHGGCNGGVKQEVLKSI